MPKPHRTFSSGNRYRYGFNGKENDNDVKGEGNQQDYGMRIYDPRVGRFLSVDPIFKNYPMLTPYQFASNTPVCAVDLDGLEGVSLSFNVNGFNGFQGREIGVGYALGPEGIAKYSYETSKIGIGAEGGIGAVLTVFPEMNSLYDLTQESVGITLSGGFLHKYSGGTVASKDAFGFTLGWSLGAGGSLSYDMADTKILKVIPWTKIADEIANSTDDAAIRLRQVVGITDQNKQNTLSLIKDWYKKTVTAAVEARKSSLIADQNKLQEVVNENKGFIDDYNKSSLFYKISNYFKKKGAEYSIKASEKKIKQNAKELEVLNKTKVETP